MTNWYVYGLHTSDSDVVRYVGYTTNPRGRYLEHLSAARSCTRRYPLYDWIRSVKSRGLEVGMVILEEGVGGAGKNAEIAWIERLQNNQLFNISPGGDIPAIPSDSRKRAGEKLKHRIFTEEHRARISEAKRGGKRPDAVVTAKEMARKNVGKKMKFSPDGLKNRQANGRKMGAINAARMWAAMSDEERQRRSELAREQMRRVWEERRNAKASANEQLGMGKAAGSAG